MSLLAYAAIFLAATVIAVPLCRRLGLGSVLGYLLAGMALGPWGMRVVEDAEGVLHIAEFGVVMLLFMIGLELQLSRLKAMRKAVFGLGLSQVLVTWLVFACIGWLAELPLKTALVVGFALSLSSTPLVLQLLSERHELNTQHGRSSFAILLFQDIAVMPALALIPLLANQVPRTLSETMSGIGQAVAVVLLLIFGGRYLLQPLLRTIAETRLKEAFTAAALLLVIGTGLLFDAVGMSMALGAFVAGVLLAESEYRHELEADIEPFKGLLLGLFFVSVGMTTNLGALVEHPVKIGLLVIGLLAIKFTIILILARLGGHGAQTARGMALALPQAGEFGFVLFALAVSYGLMERSLADTLIIVVTISMVASPLLMTLHTILERRLSRSGTAPAFDQVESEDSRVIIAGFGRFGQIIARVLRMRRIRFTALESDVAHVDFVRRFGNKVYYGDASRRDVLEAAGAARAEVFVLAMDDVDLSVRTAAMVRRHFPHLKVLARARNRQHSIRLLDLGVRYVIRETYLSSLDMAQQALESLGMSRAEAIESIERFDEHDRQALELQRESQGDERKLMQSVEQAARELEQLFERDADPKAGTPPDSA